MSIIDTQLNFDNYSVGNIIDTIHATCEVSEENGRIDERSSG